MLWRLRLITTVTALSLMGMVLFSGPAFAASSVRVTQPTMAVVYAVQQTEGVMIPQQVQTVPPPPTICAITIFNGVDWLGISPIQIDPCGMFVQIIGNILDIVVKLILTIVSILFSTSLLTHVPEEFTVGNQTVATYMGYMQVLADALLLMAVMIYGFSLLMSPVMRQTTEDVREKLPQVVIVGVLSNFSLFFMTEIVSFINTVEGALQGVLNNQLLSNTSPGDWLSSMVNCNGTVNQNFCGALSGQSALDAFYQYIIGDILVLVFAIFFIFLAIQIIFRIVFLDFLIIISPLAFIAGLFPRGEAIQQWWVSATFSTAIVGPFQVLVLSLGVAIGLGAAPVSTDRFYGLLIGPFFFLGALWLAWKLPDLLNINLARVTGAGAAIFSSAATQMARDKFKQAGQDRRASAREERQEVRQAGREAATQQQRESDRQMSRNERLNEQTSRQAQTDQRQAQGADQRDQRAGIAAASKSDSGVAYKNYAGEWQKAASLDAVPANASEAVALHAAQGEGNLGGQFKPQGALDPSAARLDSTAPLDAARAASNESPIGMSYMDREGGWHAVASAQDIPRDAAVSYMNTHKDPAKLDSTGTGNAQQFSPLQTGNGAAVSAESAAKNSAPGGSIPPEFAAGMGGNSQQFAPPQNQTIGASPPPLTASQGGSSGQAPAEVTAGMSGNSQQFAPPQDLGGSRGQIPPEFSAGMSGDSQQFAPPQDLGESRGQIPAEFSAGMSGDSQQFALPQDLGGSRGQIPPEFSAGMSGDSQQFAPAQDLGGYTPSYESTGGSPDNASSSQFSPLHSDGSYDELFSREPAMYVNGAPVDLGGASPGYVDNQQFYDHAPNSVGGSEPLSDNAGAYVDMPSAGGESYVPPPSDNASAYVDMPSAGGESYAPPPSDHAPAYTDLPSAGGDTYMPPPSDHAPAYTDLPSAGGESYAPPPSDHAPAYTDLPSAGGDTYMPPPMAGETIYAAPPSDHGPGQESSREPLSDNAGAYTDQPSGRSNADGGAGSAEPPVVEPPTQEAPPPRGGSRTVRPRRTQH